MTVTTSARMMVGVLALTLGLAGAAVAQPGMGPGGPGGGPGGERFGRGPGGPGGRGGMMGGPLGALLGVHPDLPLSALNLTDAQREQVRTIMQSHRDEGQALVQKAQASMEALRKATDATVDEGAAAQQGQALGAVIAEAAVLRGRVRGEVFAILTPEQQAEANKIAADRQQRMQQFRQKAGQRRAQRPAKQQ
ncbi:Spy/CpxP family protein refolding chaperone [Luteitalea sp.]